jgi:Cu-Zn family superoxide dismutase
MGNTIEGKAIAQIRSHDDSKVFGYITFTEVGENNDDVIISGNLKGLPPGNHGMHIHERGNPQVCCSALGDHYNPGNDQHGGRLAKDFFGNYHRHVGDLGNITVDKKGDCNFQFEDELIKIRGSYNVIGRSVVIHENEDDLGLTDNINSKTTGNSGGRIAYGIIGYF